MGELGIYFLLLLGSRQGLQKLSVSVEKPQQQNRSCGRNHSCASLSHLALNSIGHLTLPRHLLLS